MTSPKANVLPLIPNMPLTTEIVKVTPSMAENWLGKNTKNRNISRKSVVAYAQAMTAGEWLITGEAIKFADNGDLLDGQHRLHAIVESGKTVPLLVVKGLHHSVQDVLDTGKGRTAADQLAIHGHADAALLAAATKIVILYESGLFYKDSSRQQVSHRQILDYASANSMLAFACARGRSVAKGAEMRPAVAAMTFYELMKKDDQKATEFFDRCTDGVSLPAGSPILALRARQRTLHDDRTLIPVEAQVGLVFRTWNAWRAGRRLAGLPLYKAGELIACPEPK